MKKILEIILLRAGPGLINLLALVVLGQSLSVSEYGKFSTIVATAGMLSAAFFGLLYLPVAVTYASLEAKGKGDAYRSTIIVCYAICALALTVGGSFYSGGVLSLPMALILAILMGAQAIFQESLRAQLKFWTYGVAGALQSGLFLAAIITWSSQSHGYEWALSCLAASYAAGGMVSMIVSGIPSFSSFLSREHVTLVLRNGGWMTGSTFVENGLAVGTRYLILLFGNTEMLGVFSFCFDLAQRSVGFFVNVATFVFVPAAFSAEAKGQHGKFQRILVRGLISAIILAGTSAVAVSIAMVGFQFWGAGFPQFSILVFFVACITVTLNRSKKLAVDSMAIRNRKGWTVMAGYAVGATAAAGMTALAASAPSAVGVALSHAFGYVLATLLTYRIGVPQAPTGKSE